MASFAEHLPHLADAALVILLSGLIGFEREARRRPAGLKTHIVVGLSAWLLVQIGLTATRLYADSLSATPDPIRIVQAIVYGISFIGAGTIFSSGREDAARVIGLTTAASLLATTSISIAVGFGERFLACGVAVLILIVLVVIGALERRLIATKRS